MKTNRTTHEKVLNYVERHGLPPEAVNLCLLNGYIRKPTPKDQLRNVVVMVPARFRPDEWFAFDANKGKAIWNFNEALGQLKIMRRNMTGGIFIKATPLGRVQTPLFAPWFFLENEADAVWWGMNAHTWGYEAISA